LALPYLLCSHSSVLGFPDRGADQLKSLLNSRSIPRQPDARKL
jgi:hypothetical protein